MINNPETPSQITGSAAKKIEGRVTHAGMKIASAIRRVGVYDFYYDSWRRVPVPYRNETRRLVNAYNEPRERDGEEVRLHPFSQAAERGLIVGAMFAHELLRTNTVFEPFAKRMTAQFGAMRRYLGGSPYDLADALKLTGEPFAEKLEYAAGPDIIELDVFDDSPIEMQRQAIYASAVGYVGAAAVTKLLEREVRRVQPRDRRSEWSIREDIGCLTEESPQITVADFQ